MHVSQHLVDHFEHGVTFIDLSPSRDRDG